RTSLPPEVVAGVAARSPLQIILVIPLGLPEFGRVDDLRDDRRGPLRLRTLDRLLCSFSLLVVVNEDRRSILRAAIIALPILRGRIVKAEEVIEDVVVADLVGIELD